MLCICEFSLSVDEETKKINLYDFISNKNTFEEMMFS